MARLGAAPHLAKRRGLWWMRILDRGQPRHMILKSFTSPMSELPTDA